MVHLADFSSDEGMCWPSVDTIARQVGAAESTVRTALTKLEQNGWIVRKQRRNGNRNASNVYQLNIEKLCKAAQPSESDTSNVANGKQIPKPVIHISDQRRPKTTTGLDGNGEHYGAVGLEALKNIRNSVFRSHVSKV